jgi:cyclophilin family peptidyl-prolyl cis-trans isomerase
MHVNGLGRSFRDGEGNACAKGRRERPHNQPLAGRIGSQAVPSDKRARQRAGREIRLAEEAKAKKRRKQIRNVIVVAVIAGVIILIVFLTSSNSPKKGSASSTTSTTTSTTTAGASANVKAQAAANKVAVAAGCPAKPSATVNTQKYSAAPPMTIDTSKTYTATVVTTAGTFTIGLDAKAAPITVNNFVFLADKNYYHCVIFHRVIPTFMDQTGDPTGTGQGGPGYTIPDELPAKASVAADQYPLGSVAMANTGQPHTGGSQFFIVSGPEGEGLSNSYTLFGHVTSGMNVVDKINAQGSTAGVPPDVTQRMISVTISSS